MDILSEEQVRLIRSVKLLSMAELAERAGLAESSVRTYRSRGKLPEPDITIGTAPGWLPQTADPWIATLRAPVTDPRPGRHTISRSDGVAVTDDPAMAQRIVRNLTGRGGTLSYDVVPDVTCVHVGKGWKTWQWWSDGTLTRGMWHGERRAGLKSEAGIALAGTASNVADLNADLIGRLAAAVSVSTELVVSDRWTDRGWTTELDLRHHHVRYETPPDESGSFAERGLDLWTVDVASGGRFGGEGEDEERRLLFDTETAARAFYARERGSAEAKGA